MRESLRFCITVLPRLSNYTPILLNDNVRLYFNKIRGGLAKQRNRGLRAPKQQPNMSEFTSDLRVHRILSIFRHNLSPRRFQKLIIIPAVSLLKTLTTFLTTFSILCSGSKIN